MTASTSHQYKISSQHQKNILLKTFRGHILTGSNRVENMLVTQLADVIHISVSLLNKTLFHCGPGFKHHSFLCPVTALAGYVSFRQVCPATLADVRVGRHELN